ncbi:ATP-dependent DNA helicase [Tothia fuscella]|uniref:ATP-dependent DNA helicase n=1 Tax=Tothia fuscella TaxID=1048955 RepID=A0A9P4NJW1_9PEZI|nr:ATP-dependent DNA helicase [Tothia fuscella]
MKRKAEDDDNSPRKKSTIVAPLKSPFAVKILNERFGIPGFRLEQEAVIARLLHGESAVVVFPTGGGKSLCYQVPAVAFPELDKELNSRGAADGGVSIVVSPLIALMKDQVDALSRRNIYAVAMDSSKTREEFLQINSDLREGKVRILYCAPERLNNEGFVASIKQVRGGVRLIAIDEAHCISEWGHSFRPDYLKVARFAIEIKAERVVCLTATATLKVAQDVCDAFNVPPSGLFRTTMYRSNLRLVVESTTTKHAKYPLIFKFLRAHPGPTIIYVTLQKQSEMLANDLRQQGFNARSFHAGMQTDSKTQLQDEFMKNDNMVICATIAFGMGIDKATIRNVIHFDIPSSIEGYSQQIGRAGRDGLLSNCLFYLCPEDFYLRDVFVYGNLPSIQSVKEFLEDVFSDENVAKDVGESFEISQYSQGRKFDIKPTTLSIMYAQLELKFGLIRAITPKYSKYEFEATSRYFAAQNWDKSPAAMAVFKTADKKAKYHHIDVDAAANRVGVKRMDVIRKLNDWNDNNTIVLRTSGVLNVYSIVQKLPSTDDERSDIAEKLFAQMEDRQQQDLQRTKDVVKLATDRACISRKVAAYFGDESVGLPKECGHCSWCETHKPVILGKHAYKPTTAATIAHVLAHVPDRDDPRYLARIAFGIGSPRITQAKLGSSPVFESLSDHDFVVRSFAQL